MIFKQLYDNTGNSLLNLEPGTDETFLLDNTLPAVVSFKRSNPISVTTDADQLVFEITFTNFSIASASPTQHILKMFMNCHKLSQNYLYQFILRIFNQLKHQGY